MVIIEQTLDDLAHAVPFLAVQAGELTEERLDESLIRILTAKQEYFGL